MENKSNISNSSSLSFFFEDERLVANNEFKFLNVVVLHNGKCCTQITQPATHFLVSDLRVGVDTIEIKQMETNLGCEPVKNFT